MCRLCPIEIVRRGGFQHGEINWDGQFHGFGIGLVQNISVLRDPPGRIPVRLRIGQPLDLEIGVVSCFLCCSARSGRTAGQPAQEEKRA